VAGRIDVLCQPTKSASVQDKLGELGAVIVADNRATPE